MGFDLLGLFGAGLATFATPCVLPLIPIYLSVLIGGDLEGATGAQRGRLLLRAMMFALGFTLVFAALGLTASSLGSLLTHNKVWLQLGSAGLILLFGLHFLGLFRIRILEREFRAKGSGPVKRMGAGSAFVMGVVFAAGWTPCVGPVLGSVLTYAASRAADPLTGAGYLAIYGAGFALPLLLTAAFAEGAMRWIDRIKPQLPRIERVIGLLLIAVSLSLGYPALKDLISGAPKVNLARKMTTAADGRRLPAMVEIYADNCPVCKRMHPLVDRISEDCHGQHVLVQRFNISKAENRAASRSLGLVGVPTYLFLDEDGKEVGRIIGGQSEGRLRRELSSLSGAICEAGPTVPRSRPDFPPAAAAGGNKTQEALSCPSMNITATTVTAPSNPSSPSKSGTAPNAPTVGSAPAACSPSAP